MTPSQDHEQALFHAAIHLHGHSRLVFLEQVCAGDADLRQRVEALLAAQENQQSLPQPEITGQASTVLMESTSEEGPGTVIGRYKLLEKIGEGGFGAVYAAEQREPVKRRVALKLIKLGMDTRQVVARFEAERQALALMDHPNIAKVLDGGATASGRPYFVMELVKGISITTYCDQENLSPRGRLELFMQVCHAIQHAHQKGIIHRDIKPSNILVTLHDGVAVPKVIDFGIAKATQQELTEKTVYTQLQQFIGTPAYMSPEQAEISGLDIDTRSDIYSLGVLLYELLTGSTPFDTKELLRVGLDEMRRIIREREPVRPSTRLTQELARAAKHGGAEGAEEKGGVAVRRSYGQMRELVGLLRGDLDWIVLKCLEKDRSRRYETANALAMDLKRHLNNEPVLARPPSIGYRLQKAVRRHKLAFGASGAVVAMLVLGLGISWWLYLREVQAHERVVALEREQNRLRQQAEANARKAQTAQANEATQRERAEAQAYVANLNLAQHAWEQNNVGLLRELLEETAANPDRGFEWYYWQRRAHLELKTLRGHIDAVSSVAFSPDGQWIVTGSYDHTAKIWEAATGKELHTLKGQKAQVNSAAFSPDGRWIVSGGHDGTAKVWDATSGQRLVTLKGHRSQVTSAAFSPDGQRIVTGSADQTARVWDAATGRELFSLSGHSNAVWSVAFAPDGRRIATAGLDQTAKIWDANGGTELLTLRGHSDRINCVAFSADGQRIVTGSADQTTRVWDAGTGNEVVTIHGHSGEVSCVAISPDSQRIVTGSSDDQTARVWEAASGKELLTLKGHSARVESVAFSPDGRWIVTGSDDGTAKLWEAANSEESTKFRKNSSRVTCTAYSADLHRVATGNEDNTGRVWDPATGRQFLSLKGHTAQIKCVAFDPKGERIATASEDKTARAWDAVTGQELLVLKGHSAQINCVAFDPKGERIATASEDNSAKVWSATDGNLLLTLRHKERVFAAAFSPDGQRIVTGGADQAARMWDAASGKELLTLKHPNWVIATAFSPNGQRILTGSFDNTVRMWEATNGKELLILKGHVAPTTCVAFSTDGRRIVTAGQDQTVKLWEAANGKELLTLKGHTAQVQAAAFSPDGQSILSSDADGTTRLWKAATAQQVAAWELDEKAASDHLALLQQEQATAAEHERAVRVQDPGAIKEWLVLAPISFEGGGRTGSGAEALAQEQIPREADLKPRAGERVTVDQHELVWSASRSEDCLIDLNMLLGQAMAWSVAYAVCYIQCERDHTDLFLNVGSDDQAKIYLNGREIYRNEASRSWVADQDVVTGVELKAGLNVFVLKVVNEQYDWQASVRFSEAGGLPVKGMRVTLTPPEKSK
jgi:WD40 repeat protein/serine/threonine protein kinase